jgi:hypothetical protein
MFNPLTQIGLSEQAYQNDNSPTCESTSDLDFCILVASEERDRIKEDHARLGADAGELLSDFPATHMSDPNQLIALYKARYRVLVDCRRLRVTANWSERASADRR